MEDYKAKDENSIEDNEETMDNEIDTDTKNNISYQTDKDKSEKINIFNLIYAKPIIIGNALLIIIMFALLFTNYISLKEANNSIADLTLEIKNMKNAVNGIDAVANDVKFMGALMEDLEKSIFLNRLNIEISEGVVTDKVVIQKAVLYSSNDVLYGYIDLRPQPSYNSYFQGQGKFNLSDRELKAMIEEVVVALEDYISPISMYNIKMEGGKISITSNNYSVAKYEDGKVTLAGE